jgi:hypothetical protein
MLVARIAACLKPEELVQQHGQSQRACSQMLLITWASDDAV